MKLRNEKPKDTPKAFLEELASHKGQLLTDEEYEAMRSWQLETLAKPPRLEWAVAVPGLVCLLIGIGLLVAALLTWITAPEDTTMSRLMLGLVLAAFGAYFFLGNFLICRAARRRPYTERIGEVDELLQSGLVTPQEHQMIKEAIEREFKFRVPLRGSSQTTHP